MAMDMCAPSYDPVVIMEVALRVFNGDLHIGSPPDIGEREQEKYRGSYHFHPASRMPS